MSYPLELEPAIVNFITEKGSTFKRTLTWLDNDSNPIDTTWMTAKMKVRKLIPATYRSTATVGPELASISTGSGITMGAANGQISLVIPAATTSNITPGSYVYNISLVTEGLANTTGASTMYFTTPDSAGNSVASDIDLRAKVRLNDWTPANLNTVIGKWNTNQFAYLLGVNSSGGIRLELSQTGSAALTANSTVAVTATDKTDKWIRATWRNSDDRVQFFTSDDGIIWTQLGIDQSISATGIFNSTASVYIGRRQTTTTEQINGTVYYAEVRNGIDGTVVSRFDPKTYSGSGSTWVSAGVGETWTIVGSPVLTKKEAVIFKGIFEVLPEATY